MSRGTGRRRAAILTGLAAAAVAAMGLTGAEAGRRERAAEEIRRADIEFCEALKAKDKERFREFLAGDATFFGSRRISQGPEQVLEAWSVFFDPAAKQALIWKPQRVEVAKSGDLGFSIGVYEIRPAGGDAEGNSFYGQYVTIWRKEEGAWKAAVDIGTPPSEEMP